jgi:hypothetical protein
MPRPPVVVTHRNPQVQLSIDSPLVAVYNPDQQQIPWNKLGIQECFPRKWNKDDINNPGVPVTVAFQTWAHLNEFKKADVNRVYLYVFVLSLQKLGEKDRTAAMKVEVGGFVNTVTEIQEAADPTSPPAKMHVILADRIYSLAPPGSNPESGKSSTGFGGKVKGLFTDLQGLAYMQKKLEPAVRTAFPQISNITVLDGSQVVQVYDDKSFTTIRDEIAQSIVDAVCQRFADLQTMFKQLHAKQLGTIGRDMAKWSLKLLWKYYERRFLSYLQFGMLDMALSVITESVERGYLVLGNTREFPLPNNLPRPGYPDWAAPLGSTAVQHVLFAVDGLVIDAGRHSAVPHLGTPETITKPIISGKLRDTDPIFHFIRLLGVQIVMCLLLGNRQGAVEAFAKGCIKILRVLEDNGVSTAERLAVRYLLCTRMLETLKCTFPMRKPAQLGSLRLTHVLTPPASPLAAASPERSREDAGDAAEASSAALSTQSAKNSERFLIETEILIEQLTSRDIANFFLIQRKAFMDVAQAIGVNLPSFRVLPMTATLPKHYLPANAATPPRRQQGDDVSASIENDSFGECDPVAKTKIIQYINELGSVRDAVDRVVELTDSAALKYRESGQGRYEVVLRYELALVLAGQAADKAVKILEDSVVESLAPGDWPGLSLQAHQLLLRCRCVIRARMVAEGCAVPAELDASIRDSLVRVIGLSQSPEHKKKLWAALRATYGGRVLPSRARPDDDDDEEAEEHNETPPDHHETGTAAARSSTEPDHDHEHHASAGGELDRPPSRQDTASPGMSVVSPPEDEETVTYEGGDDQSAGAHELTDNTNKSAGRGDGSDGVEDLKSPSPDTTASASPKMVASEQPSPDGDAAAGSPAPPNLIAPPRGTSPDATEPPPPVIRIELQERDIALSDSRRLAPLNLVWPRLFTLPQFSVKLADEITARWKQQATADVMSASNDSNPPISPCALEIFVAPPEPVLHERQAVEISASFFSSVDLDQDATVRLVLVSKESWHDEAVEDSALSPMSINARSNTEVEIASAASSDGNPHCVTLATTNLVVRSVPAKERESALHQSVGVSTSWHVTAKFAFAVCHHGNYRVASIAVEQESIGAVHVTHDFNCSEAEEGASPRVDALLSATMTSAATTPVARLARSASPDALRATVTDHGMVRGPLLARASNWPKLLRVPYPKWTVYVKVDAPKDMHFFADPRVPAPQAACTIARTDATVTDHETKRWIRQHASTYSCSYEEDAESLGDETAGFSSLQVPGKSYSRSSEIPGPYSNIADLARASSIAPSARPSTAGHLIVTSKKLSRRLAISILEHVSDTRGWARSLSRASSVYSGPVTPRSHPARASGVLPHADEDEDDELPTVLDDPTFSLQPGGASESTTPVDPTAPAAGNAPRTRTLQFSQLPDSTVEPAPADIEHDTAPEPPHLDGLILPCGNDGCYLLLPRDEDVGLRPAASQAVFMLPPDDSVDGGGSAGSRADEAVASRWLRKVAARRRTRQLSADEQFRVLQGSSDAASIVFKSSLSIAEPVPLNSSLEPSLKRPPSARPPVLTATSPTGGNAANFDASGSALELTWRRLLDVIPTSSSQRRQARRRQQVQGCALVTLKEDDADGLLVGSPSYAGYDLSRSPSLALDGPPGRRHGTASYFDVPIPLSPALFAVDMPPCPLVPPPSAAPVNSILSCVSFGGQSLPGDTASQENGASSGLPTDLRGATQSEAPQQELRLYYGGRGAANAFRHGFGSVSISLARPFQVTFDSRCIGDDIGCWVRVKNALHETPLFIDSSSVHLDLQSPVTHYVKSSSIDPGRSNPCAVPLLPGDEVRFRFTLTERDGVDNRTRQAVRLALSYCHADFREPDEDGLPAVYNDFRSMENVVVGSLAMDFAARLYIERPPGSSRAHQKGFDLNRQNMYSEVRWAVDLRPHPKAWAPSDPRLRRPFYIRVKYRPVSWLLNGYAVKQVKIGHVGEDMVRAHSFGLFAMQQGTIQAPTIEIFQYKSDAVDATAVAEVIFTCDLTREFNDLAIQGLNPNLNLWTGVA